MILASHASVLYVICTTPFLIIFLSTIIIVVLAVAMACCLQRKVVCFESSVETTLMSLSLAQIRAGWVSDCERANARY